MQALIWIGTALTLAGVGLLLWCILRVFRARKATSDEAALKAIMQNVVTLNLAALALSGLGLMMVVVGIFLS